MTTATSAQATYIERQEKKQTSCRTNIRRNPHASNVTYDLCNSSTMPDRNSLLQTVESETFHDTLLL